MRDIQYADKLSKMIAIETISHSGVKEPEKFYPFHRLLEELFPNIHKHGEKYDFDGSLMFKIKGSGDKKPLMLMSHMDVVSAEGSWTQPPFSGYNDGERIWGRGTLDTKGSLFALMQGVEELLEEGKTFPYDIYLVSTCTEEVGGEGARAIVEYLSKNKINIGLLVDEGGAVMDDPIPMAKGRFAMIGVIEKGGGNLKITAKADGGHSSAPPKNSPIVRLARFVTDIEDGNYFKTEISKEVRRMFQVVSKDMTGAQGFALKNLWLTSPIIKKVLPSISSVAGAMLKTTVAFTMQEGSQGRNVLPQSAYVIANMRFIPHQNAEESIEIMKKVAKKYDLEVEVLSAKSATNPTDIDGDGYKIVEKTIREIFEKTEVSPYVMVGGTDSRYFESVTDHTIRFAPIYMDNKQFASIHTVDENIYINSLPKAVDFYKKLTHNY